MSSEEFRQHLLNSGLVVDSGLEGVYHRSFSYESIVRGVEYYVSRAGKIQEDHRLFYPPIMPESTLVTSGYVRSFPNLMGVVTSFEGADKDMPTLLSSLATGGDWTALLSSTGVAMCSAACHNLYPQYSRRTVPNSGLLYEVQGVCFRHEPSLDPARMQSFRMHEFVYMGTPEGALVHRDTWIALAVQLLTALGLTLDTVVANDPFFGRVGNVLANGQLEKELKFELVTPISSSVPGAIASGNYHEDHLALDFDISVESGGSMHSACFAFGLDRIALALINVHGTNLAQWPHEVRALLSMPETTATMTEREHRG